MMQNSRKEHCLELVVVSVLCHHDVNSNRKVCTNVKYLKAILPVIVIRLLVHVWSCNWFRFPSYNWAKYRNRNVFRIILASRNFLRHQKLYSCQYIQNNIWIDVFFKDFIFYQNLDWLIVSCFSIQVSTVLEHYICHNH